MFVKLDGRQVLVVGAGQVGEPKIRGLLSTGARIHVVSQSASVAVREWARNGEIVLEERGFVLRIWIMFSWLLWQRRLVI